MVLVSHVRASVLGVRVASTKARLAVLAQATHSRAT